MTRIVRGKTNRKGVFVRCSLVMILMVSLFTGCLSSGKPQPQGGEEAAAPQPAKVVELEKMPDTLENKIRSFFEQSQLDIDEENSYFMDDYVYLQLMMPSLNDEEGAENTQEPMAEIEELIRRIVSRDDFDIIYITVATPGEEIPLLLEVEFSKDQLETVDFNKVAFGDLKNYANTYSEYYSEETDPSIYENEELKKQAQELGLLKEAEFIFVDFALAPENRVWKKDYVYVDSFDGDKANRILWLARTHMYSQEYPIMGSIKETFDEEKGQSYYQLDITDECFEPDEEYLINAMANYLNTESLTDYKQGFHFKVTKNGERYSGVPLNSNGLYFCAAFSSDDAKSKSIYTGTELALIQNRPEYKMGGRLLTDRPRPTLSDLPEEIQTQISDFFLPTDPIKYQLDEFIYQVLPQSYVSPEQLEFSSPKDLNGKTIKRMAFRVTESVTPSPPKDVLDNGGRVNQAELDSSRFLTFNTTDESIGYVFEMNRPVILPEHLDISAKKIFGEDLGLVHESLGDKTWSYNDLFHWYAHFPGGTGDGYGGGTVPIVLDYTDQGTYYEVIIAFYQYSTFENSQSILVVNEAGEEEYKIFTVFNAVEIISTQAPRGKITLNKTGDGGVTLYAYKHLGAGD